MKSQTLGNPTTRLVRFGIVTSLAAALMVPMQSEVSAGKGGNGKGGGGNGGGGGAGFDEVYFDLVTDEFDEYAEPRAPEDGALWGDLCGAIGFVQNDYPDDTVTATGASSSLGQPVELANLVAHYLSPLSEESDADLETCFPGITDPAIGFTAFGVVSVARDDDPDTPEVEEVVIRKAVNGGFAKNGREMHYTLTIRAEPLFGGLWQPLGVETAGDSTSLVLLDWTLEVTSGKASRGCQLFGTFDGRAFLSLVRRAGPRVEGECGS